MIKYSVKCLLQGHYTPENFAPAAGCIHCSIQREILSEVKRFRMFLRLKSPPSGENVKRVLDGFRGSNAPRSGEIFLEGF